LPTVHSSDKRLRVEFGKTLIFFFQINTTNMKNLLEDVKVGRAFKLRGFPGK
jgi:hypothetical protein